MKLDKFVISKMDVREMSAIKAGSGKSTCGSKGSICVGNDSCSYQGDSCPVKK